METQYRCFIVFEELSAMQIQRTRKGDAQLGTNDFELDALAVMLPGTTADLVRTKRLSSDSMVF